jgi:hypothetical protein
MQAPVQDWLRIPLKPIMDQYVKDSARSAPTWIRTPSIVVSWSEKPDGTIGNVVGGHNLSAKTSSMRADATVPIGDLRVVDSPTGRVLLFNPSDELRIGSVVRQFGRGLGKAPTALEAELKGTLRSTAPVERPLAEALAFRTAPIGTRGLTARHLPVGLEDIGWRYTDTVPNTAQVETIRALADPQSSVWILERTGNSRAIFTDILRLVARVLVIPRRGKRHAVDSESDPETLPGVGPHRSSPGANQRSKRGAPVRNPCAIRRPHRGQRPVLCRVE